MKTQLMIVGAMVLTLSGCGKGPITTDTDSIVDPTEDAGADAPADAPIDANPCDTPGGSVTIDGAVMINCDHDGFNGCEVNASTDPRNCGKCGTVCPSFPRLDVRCTAGDCTAGDCANGWYDCNNNSFDGCESATPCS